MRPRQGPSVRHRVEDGVKKHRGLTAASSLRVSRHVTLRKAPSSSSATQQSKSRTARTSRAAGAYLRTQCIRWVSVRVVSGVWPRLCAPERKCQATVKVKRVAARTLLGTGACAHYSAGVCVRIRTRNACAFATARHTVAARKKMLHIDLCESERTASCGQHVCAGTVLVTACSARIYPAHLREINAGACACVSMSALCTCARVKGGWLAPIAMFRDADRVLPVLATVCLPRALILRLGRRGWPARN